MKFVETLRRLDRLMAIGRQSERAYVRFYPNPGFMLPWGSKRLVWSWHKGFVMRARGSRQQPPAWVARMRKEKA